MDEPLKTKEPVTRRMPSDAETHHALGKFFRTRSSFPGTYSGQTMLPKDSLGWAKVLGRIGNPRTFIARYEFENPEVNKIPMPVKAPHNFPVETVFNAVASSLKERGVLPPVIDKEYTAADINAALRHGGISEKSSVIKFGSCVTNLEEFAVAAGLAEYQGEKLVPVANPPTFKQAYREPSGRDPLDP